jgi:hypothetical protein
VAGDRDRLSTYTALLVVSIAVGITIRAGFFVPWGTDTGAYIGQAESWAKAELFSPVSFLLWAPWSVDAIAESPLGYRPGPIRGTVTGVYPLGFPVLLAVSLKIGGALAPYVVTPLCLGLLVWCTYLLGAQLSTKWAGVAASLLVAVTPVTLSQTLMPMSDVPAAAFWMLSLILGFRPGHGAPTAAGLSTALAIMIRPNLAPLGAVIAAVVMVSPAPLHTRLTRLAIYGACAALGPALLLWSQAVLYGSPFATGYLGTTDFFDRARIPANARFYPRLLAELHTPLVAGGLVMVPLALRRMRQGAHQHRAALIALAALAIVVVNYVLYLPYLAFEGWYWLRFMLPALTVLFVLFAAVIDFCRIRIAVRSRLAATVMVAPVLVVAAHPVEQLRFLFSEIGVPLRFSLMGHYLREALPGNAVIFTYLHGTATANYTGRPIVRLDAIAPEKLDGIIDDLRRHAYRPVFVLDRVFDWPFFRERFTPSKYVRLDWPARAEFHSRVLVTYHDPEDREAFLSGDRYPVDVLNWPGDDLYRGSWSVLHVPMESIDLPLPQESVMFTAALQATYRNVLKRPEADTAVDPNTSTTWVQRYLRFRLHGCDHAIATEKVFRQIDGEGAQPLCQRPLSAVMPPWNETVDFRRQLEQRVGGRAFRSFVDLEGQAVWVQEYLSHRVRSCSHREAMSAVLARVQGGTWPAECAARGGG